MIEWRDGKTAPQDGTQFIAIYTAQKASSGVAVEVMDVRVLRRVWSDGQHSYAQPDFWIPVPQYVKGEE